MGMRRARRVLVGAVVAGLVASPFTWVGAAAAVTHELPFLCAQDWTGSTRAKHQPSSEAIDFNRPADLGRIVQASAAGIVSRVENAGTRSYGRWVQVQHPDGGSTVYAHLKAQWVVPGQFVDQGTPLGRVGATGNVSGAHLHYEQRAGRDVVPGLFAGLPFVRGVAQVSQNCPDVPLAGDWDGDRADEVAVFRRESGRGRFELATADGGSAPVAFGRGNDLPVVGDWDGDGRTDVGVRRQLSRVFLLRTADGTITRKRLGLRADVPITGDWDGDGATDIGIWRPRSSAFRLLMPDGRHRVVRLGSPSAQPVTGDWDGDGLTDVGVFDTSTATFLLRTVTPAGAVVETPVPLGTSTDLPVTGDWDGNGVTDVGTWAPGTATYTLRVAPRPLVRRASARARLRTVVFGNPRQGVGVR